MTVPAATLLTYAQIGIREDLSDDIFNVDPTDTPFFSMCEKGKATQTKHEWQTQALASVDSANRVLEGDDATTDAITPTVRLYNTCQISDKVCRVSGTDAAVDIAGVDDPLAYQEAIKGMELKRDVETMILSNVAQNAGAAGVVRVSAGVISWIGTNQDVSTGLGVNGVAPATLDGNATRTDGTQRAFTEVQLKNVLQACWTSGGKPTSIFTGGFNKQVFSTFTGRALQTEDTAKKKIIAAVDTYVSDFGTLSVAADRFQRARDVLVVQPDMWAIAHLNGRKMVSIPLAKTGDSDRRQILTEFCLVSRNEKASGIVADLTTA